MGSHRRLWRCPVCQEDYQIPMAADDPMACPKCLGRETVSDFGSSSAGSPRSPDTELTTTCLNDRTQLDPWAAVLAESDTRVEPPALTEDDLRVVSPPTANRRSRKRLIVTFTTLAIAAIVSTLWVGRPYSVRDLFTGQVVVRRNPVDAAPLAILIDATTRVPASVAVEIDDGVRTWTYLPPKPGRTEHKLTIVGLHPGRTHQVRIHAQSDSGWLEQRSKRFAVVTPPLPDDFPPLNTTVSKLEAMEPGVTLFAVNHWHKNVRDDAYGYVIMVDEAGDVVWYCRTGLNMADVQPLRDGHILVNDAKYRAAYEIDLLGNVTDRWRTEGPASPAGVGGVLVEADTLHHEINELPSQNLLALSTTLKQIDDFPTSETDPDAPPGPAEVVGDEVIEFTPEGKVVRRWSMFDVLDMHRICYGSLTDFWKNCYPREGEQVKDWSHANGIVVDPQDGNLVVSLRHQDCIIKVDFQTNRLLWILGDPGNWRAPWSEALLVPKGKLEWPYHQHGVGFTPEGNLVMYDNGNYRALPFDPKVPAPVNQSRVVEFRIDEKNRTVEQVWEYRGPNGESFYCPFYGDADHLSKTGNVLVTDGGHCETEGGTPTDLIASERHWARIFEVTRAKPAEKVFEIVIDSGLGKPDGWSIYRSERLRAVQTLADLTAGRRFSRTNDER